MVDWRHAVDGKWRWLRFGDQGVETNAARVETHAHGIGGGDPERVEMKCPRAMPRRSEVAVPLESARILWQRR
jgi:hypothetical protein